MKPTRKPAPKINLENTPSVGALIYELNNYKKDLVQTKEESVKEVKDTLSEVKNTLTEKTKEVDDTLNTVVSSLEDAFAHIKTITKGEPGEPADEEAIEQRLLDKIPKLEEIVNQINTDEIAEKASGMIKPTPASLKIIKEEVQLDKEELVPMLNEASNLKDLKLTLDNISDLANLKKDLNAEISRSKSYQQVSGGGLNNIQRNGTTVSTGQTFLNFTGSGVNSVTKSGQTTTVDISGGSGGGIGGSGTTNYLPKFTASTTVGDSQLFDDGTNVGIGTNTPNKKLEIFGVTGETSVSTSELYITSQVESGAGADPYYGYADMSFNLYNASAPTPLVPVFAIGMEGVYNNAGTLTANDFYIYNEKTGTYNLIVDANNNVGIGGTSTRTINVKADGNVTFNSATASRIAIFDASKNLISADTATYPSLTELSYVKGVTSSIQTQLNAKGSGTVTTVSVTTANGVSGSVANATTTPAITLTLGDITPTTIKIGTLGYTPANSLIWTQSSVNSYNQLITQNTNSGASASSDIIVNNDLATDTTFYGDFGMNSSGFVGTGNLSKASAVYLTSTSGDLSLGTTTANDIHFVVNSGATDILTLTSAGAVNMPGATASTIAIFDASKNLISATTATYPSLTELSYVKGVTSSIQTQLNAKGAGTVTSVGFTGGLISVATATTTPALTVAGTSGGIPYFSSASTWASSAALAANALVIGGGTGAAPTTTTTGTGVLTALGVNVGSAGAFVTFNGALGTPSSGTVTNLTGTASININGTVGATTPAAGTFTTLVAGSTTSLLLGTAGSAVGNIGFRNATSGTATVAPPTGALGTYTVTLPNAASTLPIFGQQITFSGPTAARTVTLPNANFTVARTDAANTFTGIQSMTSPDFTTSITTSSTSFTALAGATTLLTLGGTGASASTNFPSTLDATSSTTGAIRTAGGISAAKAANFGTTVTAGISTATGYTTTATAAGTTTMTISSTEIQVWTGTSTQTVKLPTTSVVAGAGYTIVNNSTGSVTVQSSGANTILVLGAGMTGQFTAQVATPTTAANWGYSLIEYVGLNKATTMSANAVTIDLAYKTNSVTNNSAATMAITIPTAGAIDGEMRVVRVYDFSAAAQTIGWTNTENSTVSAPTTSNGSTTLPLTVGFMYNSATSKWRCIASA